MAGAAEHREEDKRHQPEGGTRRVRRGMHCNQAVRRQWGSIRTLEDLQERLEVQGHQAASNLDERENRDGLYTTGSSSGYSSGDHRILRHCQNLGMQEMGTRNVPPV